VEKHIDMIKIKSINQKSIKLIFLVLLQTIFSCSSVKKSSNDYLVKSLEDYIKSYKSYDFETPLEYIMISTKSNDGILQYIISDAPKKVFLGDLIKSQDNSNTSELLGYYKGFACKIKSDSLQNYKQLFEKLDENLMIGAKESSIIKRTDGKEYNVDLSLLNWTPNLTMIFDRSTNSQKVILNE